MMHGSALALVCVCVGLAAAAPSREKRQIGCVSAFQNVPNVCVNNPKSQVFFTHPSDPSKFLQCDVLNRMYVIQCPVGEVFDISQSGCHPQQTTQKPVTAAPYVPPVTQPPRPVQTAAPWKPVQTAAPWRPPVTNAPVQTNPPAMLPNNVNNNGNNPCTAASVARGQLYFPYAGDNSKFIECDMLGNPSTMSCPKQGLVWDQNILSCVYPINTANQGNQGNQGGQGATAGPSGPQPTPAIGKGQGGNPCTQKALSSGRLFFPHSDRTKYIQCDLWGQAFVNSCPAKLVWNAYLETCYSPVLQMSG